MKGNKNGASIVTIGSGILLMMGWPFFRFVTYGGKKDDKKGTKANRKKWFQLKHTTINHPKHKYLEEYERGKAWCEAQPMRDWYIRNWEGLKLHSSFFPADNPERLVVMCHGYRGTRFGSMGHMAEFLHNENCSLLMIDQRCCGESEGKYITFGAKEQYDVLDWVRRLEEENPDGLPVYLYGQSMGATTVLLSAGHKLPKEVKGIIADCGFHSMKQQLRDMASGWFHMHWIEFLLFRVDIFCRLCAGFSMKEADTTAALRKNRIPILFFHGSEDTYVLPENSMKNYSLSRAEKELVIVPDARHLCSSYAEPELYKSKLMDFFQKNG